MKSKKIVKIVVFISVFLFVFPFMYILAETNHECHGENCEICEQITVCEEQVRKISLGGGIATVVAAFSMFYFALKEKKGNRAEKIDTLIALKVKALT